MFFSATNEGSDKNEFARRLLKHYMSTSRKKLTYPGDMWNLTTELTEPVVPEPEQITEQEMQDDFFKKGSVDKGSVKLRCQARAIATEHASHVRCHHGTV